MTSAPPTLKQMIADAELHLSELEEVREQLAGKPYPSSVLQDFGAENNKAMYEAKLWLTELYR